MSSYGQISLKVALPSGGGGYLSLFWTGTCHFSRKIVAYNSANMIDVMPTIPQGKERFLRTISSDKRQVVFKGLIVQSVISSDSTFAKLNSSKYKYPLFCMFPQMVPIILHILLKNDIDNSALRRKKVPKNNGKSPYPNKC